MGAVIAGGLLAGCATPYQRMGFSGGYRDSEVSRGVYRIEVRGNAFTSVDTLEDYFHRRASAICRPHTYEWSFDSGTERGPSTFIANPGPGRSTVVTEQPGLMKGWVTGVVTCDGEPAAVAKRRSSRKEAAKRPEEVLIQVIDVESGKVANVPEDAVRGRISTSRRLALVTGGKVAAITPEGHRVNVDVGKVAAAKTLGYRLLSGAELAAESEASAISED